MIHDSEKICPRCGAAKMREWAELSDDEKLLIERLPDSAEYSPKQRKKHRFCTRCWFEDQNIGPVKV